MYIIFGSKKDVYESIPLDGIEIVEKYLYKFYNEVKLELNIAKVNDENCKIKVTDCADKKYTNYISAKFFGNFSDADEARKEIEELIFYGNLKTELEKIF